MALMTYHLSSRNIIAGENLSQYSLVYLNTVDSRYYLADSNSTEQAVDCTGIVLQTGGIAEGESGAVQISSSLVSNLAWSWQPGQRLYVGVSGAITTDPSSYKYSKSIGYAVTATQISFDPQVGWSNVGDEIEISGDQLEIDYVPESYTPELTPETNSLKQLGSHLKGLDNTNKITEETANKWVSTLEEARETYNLSTKTNLNSPMINQKRAELLESINDFEDALSSVASVTIADGTTNTSEEYATPIMTGDNAPSSIVVSASSVNTTYSAYKAFDRNVTSDSFWAPNPYIGYPHWIKVDFGAGNEKAINRFRYYSGANLFPTYWMLQGSNVSSPSSDRFSTDWIALVDMSNIAESDYSTSQYSSWYNFRNGVKYRHYRMLITKGYYEAYPSVGIRDIQLVEAETSPSVTYPLAGVSETQNIVALQTQVFSLLQSLSSRADIEHRHDYGVNVLDYGADPTGVNDSTTAIQNAINDAVIRGAFSNLLTSTAVSAQVFFPPGHYLVTSVLYCKGTREDKVINNSTGAIIQGTPNSIIIFKPTGSTSVLQTCLFYPVSVRDMIIMGEGPVPKIAIYMRDIYENLDKVRISNVILKRICNMCYARGRSSTSLTVGTGSKTFVTEAGLPIVIGNKIVATSRTTPFQSMYGLVTSYSGTSLTINVATTSGSGTKNDWNITGEASMTSPSSYGLYIAGGNCSNFDNLFISLTDIPIYLTYGYQGRKWATDEFTFRNIALGTTEYTGYCIVIDPHSTHSHLSFLGALQMQSDKAISYSNSDFAQSMGGWGTTTAGQCKISITSVNPTTGAILLDPVIYQRGLGYAEGDNIFVSTGFLDNSCDGTFDTDEHYRTGRAAVEPGLSLGLGARMRVTSVDSVGGVLAAEWIDRGQNYVVESGIPFWSGGKIRGLTIENMWNESVSHSETEVFLKYVFQGQFRGWSVKGITLAYCRDCSFIGCHDYIIGDDTVSTLKWLTLLYCNNISLMGCHHPAGVGIDAGGLTDAIGESPSLALYK